MKCPQISNFNTSQDFQSNAAPAPSLDPSQAKKAADAKDTPHPGQPTVTQPCPGKAAPGKPHIEIRRLISVLGKEISILCALHALMPAGFLVQFRATSSSFRCPALAGPWEAMDHIMQIFFLATPCSHPDSRGWTKSRWTVISPEGTPHLQPCQGSFLPYRMQQRARSRLQRGKGGITTSSPSFF